jgi:predicted nucleotidyltransferase
MRLEHYSAEKLKKEILEIVGQYLDLTKYRIFFFGSRVTGKGTDRSDIDVGIDGPEPVPPMVKFAIEEKIEELPTLYKIEIVDFRRLPLKFREVVSQNKEFLNI